MAQHYHTVDRPYVITFHSSGTSYLLTSEEAQRLLDEYPVHSANSQRIVLVGHNSDKVYDRTTLRPATRGGGPAFVKVDMPDTAKSDPIDHYDGLSGQLIVSMPRACAEECSTPGQDADESVTAWLKDARVVWHADDDELRRIVKACGGWCDEDLTATDMDTIKRRVLWMAACDWREEHN